MVHRSQQDGWQLPGTQTPYKRDHRRTRGRAARWNAGTWPVADRGGVWVCGACLPASIIGRGCVTLSNLPLLPVDEREDEWDPELIRPLLPMPSWDPETETTASCRDFWNNRLSTRPSSGGGGDALTLSRSSSLSLWVARPEASCSSAYRQLIGARTGGAACLHLAQRHRSRRQLRMRCGSRGGCRGPPSATSRLGAATGGRVEAAAARRGRKC